MSDTLSRSCRCRFSNSEIEVDILKKRLVLSDSVHDFGKLDLVNVQPSHMSLKDASLPFGKDVRSHDFSVVVKNINKFLWTGETLNMLIPIKEQKFCICRTFL